MAKKKKAGRPAGTTTGQSSRSIVREISDVTQLKPEIVQSVLNAWTDIFIRNVIVDGKFHWPRAFSVKTKKIKEHKGYDVTTGQYEIKPERNILQMVISPRIRNFWKWKEYTELNQSRGVTQENWRDYYKDEKETGEK